MEFVKAHGAGNDFVLLPDHEGRLTLTAPLVRALCTPHLGVGGDGVIRVAPARPGVDADVFMDYWNADGSVSEMCGNGVRCVAKFVADRGFAGDTVRVDTRGGVKAVRIVQRRGGKVTQARVDMGPPVIGMVDEPLDLGDRKVRVTTVSMGNPHAVLVVDDVRTAALHDIAPLLQRHEAFPDSTNVEVIEVAQPVLIRGRIFERGVGETLASGTGASAMAAAAQALGLASERVMVQLPGGELLVERDDATLWVTGPAVEVAHGELDEAWLATI